MMTIKSISRKQIETKFGPKEKLGIQFVERPGVWVDSWVGAWNQNWKIGDQIEVKKDQWKSREYQGKTYWTLSAPPEARGFINLQPITEALERLQERVEALEEAVYTPEEVAEEEIPIVGAQNEANDEIPF